MRRKLVKQGRNALTVTIPSGWAKKYNLKPGDEVEIEEGELLIISTEKGNKLKSIEFDTREIKRFSNYYIGYFYHMGFDEVKIFYNDPQVVRITKKKLSDLLGYEVIESGKNYILLKSFSADNQQEFDVVLRRVFLLIKTMSDECLDHIKNKQYKNLIDVRQLEGTNNKFTDFCIRILNKQGYKDDKKKHLMYALIRDLEKLCDNYKYICDILKDKSAEFFMNEDIILSLGKANGYFNEFYGLFYVFDEKKISDFIDHGKKLLADISGITPKNKEEFFLLHYALDITRSIFECKGLAFELNLDS